MQAQCQQLAQLAPTAPGCEEALQQAINAYHQLVVSASAVLSVKMPSGLEVEYNRRSIPELKAYIKSLNMVCPCAAAYAVLGIPTNRRTAKPVYGNRSRTNCGPFTNCC